MSKFLKRGVVVPLALNKRDTHEPATAPKAEHASGLEGTGRTKRHGDWTIFIAGVAA